MRADATSDDPHAGVRSRPARNSSTSAFHDRRGEPGHLELILRSTPTAGLTLWLPATDHW